MNQFGILVKCVEHMDGIIFRGREHICFVNKDKTGRKGLDRTSRTGLVWTWLERAGRIGLDGSGQDRTGQDMSYQGRVRQNRTGRTVGRTFGKNYDIERDNQLCRV